MTKSQIEELRELKTRMAQDSISYDGVIYALGNILSRIEAEQGVVTAADRAMPVGVVVDEAAKHDEIGWEIIMKPTHKITLEPGTKLYLHPEGNETVCDMCEVLAKFGEAEQGADKGEQGLREAVRLWLLAAESCQDLPDLSVGRISMPLKKLDDLRKIISTPDKAVEPLAVLADRKGYDLRVVRLDEFIMVELTHQTCATTEKDWAETECPTYAAAEAKARQYLESLEDKK